MIMTLIITASAIEVTLSNSYNTIATGYPVTFSANVSESDIISFWNWGDGCITTNRLTAHHSYSATGDYAIVFIAVNAGDMTIGMAAQSICVIEGTTHYVAPSGNQEPPFTSWETATPYIQEAVDIAGTLPGTRILVTNGVYDEGAFYDPDSNSVPLHRIVLDKPVMLQSVNGPEYTIIDAGADETNMRCVYMGTGACMSGFTICNGNHTAYGGGIYGIKDNVISACHVVSNSAGSGGGIRGGTLYNCLLQTNRATSYAGGGAIYSTLNHCRLIDNCAEQFGGAASGSTLYDCYGSGNYACYTSYSQYMFNHYITILQFCSVYFSEPEKVYTCDYRLSSFSPCINRGNNTSAIGTYDLAQNSRIQGGIVDMGAFEYAWDTTAIPVDWLANYNLETNGLDDHADFDGDGVSNRDEWRTGTDPTDYTSFLHILSAANSSSYAEPNGLFTVKWASSQNISYSVLRTYNLNEPLSVIASNILGHPNLTTYTDPTPAEHAFYRVVVD